MPRAPKRRLPQGADVDLDPNTFVKELGEQLRATGSPSYVQKFDELDAPRALAESSDVPELVTLIGYLGATIPRPGSADPELLSNQWCLLYLDAELRNWLLVERTGIVRRLRLDNKNTTEDPRDVLWVKADAAIGRGSGQLSSEAQFLSGDFTQARDLEAAPSGGTLDASTGVFCEARSPNCCQVCTVRTRR